MKPDAPLFLDSSVRLDRITHADRDVTIIADAVTREALAERLKLSEVGAFEARVTAKRFRGGMQVVGRVKGSIVQPCVVTLEPVHQDINEPVDRVFLPISQKAKEPEPDTEVFVDLEGEDPPDYFDGNELDLTELLVESFSLAIDPYPRAPGAEIESIVPPEDSSVLSPFAALKVLKPGNDKD